MSSPLGGGGGGGKAALYITAGTGASMVVHIYRKHLQIMKNTSKALYIELGTTRTAPRKGLERATSTNDHLRNPGVAALEEQRAVQ